MSLRNRTLITVGATLIAIITVFVTIVRTVSPRPISDGPFVFHLFVGPAIGLGLLLWVEKTILSRLAAIRESLSLVGQSGELSGRVPVTGSDELAELSITINSTLAALEQSQREQVESEARYRVLFAHSAAPILVASRDGRYLDCNDAALRFLECTREQLLSRRIGDHSPLGRDGVLEVHASVLDSSRAIEVDYTVEGRIKTLELTITPAIWGGETVLFGIGQEITERKQMEATIRYQAYHDALTGLPNRLLFKERLDLALSQGARDGELVAVIFLDLDRFKTINDTLGHSLGDNLLQAVAERLSRELCDGETITRLGGDEFVLLIPRLTDTSEVGGIAQRILDLFSSPWLIGGHELHVTCSVGVSLYPFDGQDSETLMKNADTAMYRAKEHGRNNAQMYTAAMNAQALELLAMETSLRRALEREEFIVYYQPQVDLNSGEVVGMEALVRWRHPVRGIVAPGEFIPLAERTGLIIPIGEWVLRTACEQNKAWQQQGLPPLRVAVNLSARQFQQPHLVQTIARILAETELDPHYLELEITESVAMQNAAFTVAVLKELRDMGIHISLDDFGTAYSSLDYLRRFPMHSLKIDRSFIKDLAVNANDAAIATAVIALAHSMNLHVTAEGVETDANLSFLQSRQCDRMQGYLFSPPLPAAEAELLLMEGRRLTPPAVLEAAATIQE